MITPEKYNLLKLKMIKFDAWVDTQRNPKNGWASYKPSEVPDYLERVTNDERSSVEAYEFYHNPPDKYFLYVARKICSPGVVSYEVNVTTWTGQILGHGRLGHMYFCGRPPYQSKRYTIVFEAINGIKYKGTYFASAGDFCRVKRVT